MSLNFSAFQLKIDDKIPSVNDLKIFFQEGDYDIQIEETYYIISIENLNNQYFWLNVRHGKAFPYSSFIVNTDDAKKLDNPRSEKQVEPRNQLFILYSIPDKTLYLSNANKKLFLREYMATKSKDKVVIQAFIEDIRECLKHLKKINKMKLDYKIKQNTGKRNHMEIAPDLIPLKDLGDSVKFTFQADFKNAKVTDRLCETIGKFITLKQEDSIDSLTLIGQNEDEDVSSVLNVDQIIKKINVPIEKNSKGLYRSDIVKDTLIKIIENNKDA